MKRGKILLLLILTIILFSLNGVFSKHVESACGEGCPQECVDHDAPCTLEERQDECQETFGYCFGPCYDDYHNPSFCRGVCGHFMYKNVCDYDCDDGTKEGECSTTKPKKCVDGILVDACEECGCDQGYACVTISQKCTLLCTDTDVDVDHPDGINYGVKGLIKAESVIEGGTWDSCWIGAMPHHTKIDNCVGSDCYLMEYYCDPNIGDQARSDYHLCSGGCSDGVCATCGDGILDIGEECDDGNTDPEDGCSSICTNETCQDFTTNDTCLAFTDENCTWTPPGTTSNPEGGCCPSEEEWQVGFGCGGSDNICRAGLFLRGDFPDTHNRNDDYGPGLDSEIDMYCAKISNDLSYGFWYPVETY